MNKNQPSVIQNKIGGKTLRLFDLAKLGLNVPKFKFISADFLVKNLPATIPRNHKIISSKESFSSPDHILNPDSIKGISQKLASELNCRSFAVRSSAMVEDSSKSSFAGQFKTLINVSKDNLPQAIREVAAHAYDYLNGTLENFSIIVQEYIEPDFSGITFTRNPNGNREMIMEYHHGRGEEIVGGKIKPEKLEFYWNYYSTADKLPNLSTAIENFKKIEKFYDFPEDVEWCVKNGTWYFLQTRPITTATEKDYKQSLFLDDSLPRNEKFYFEKTEICETAPRPTPITLNILEEIYKSGGPIDLAYKKHKVSYRALPILKIIGNELYIDREAELKTLLPSYSFLKNENLAQSSGNPSSGLPSPKFSGFKGFFTTLKNSFRLQFIKSKNYREFFNKLDEALRENPGRDETVGNSTGAPMLKNPLRQFLQTFLSHYSLIFEINLLAKTSLDRLQRLLKNEQVDIVDLLNYHRFIQKDDIDLRNIQPSENLTGNSLEITDESKFTSTTTECENPTRTGTGLTPEKWWNKLPSFKKNLLENPLKEAIIYNHLREINRWLVVKDIQNLRNILLEIAKKYNFTDPKNIYYSSLPSLIKNEPPNETHCLKIKSEYLEYSKFQLPKILIYRPPGQNPTGSTIGLSPGVVEGILIEEAELENLIPKNDQKLTGNNSPKKSQPSKTSQIPPLILYSKILSPDLTRYFSHIKGLISESGGLLSHLAIVARESGIPVISNFTPNQNGISPGTRIKIDGASGTITKI